MTIIACAAPTVKNSGAKHMTRKTATLTPAQLADLRATLIEQRTITRQLCEAVEYPGRFSGAEVRQMTIAAKSIYLHLFDIVGIDLDTVMVADRKRKQ